MDRLVQRNVLAMSGRAVEAAGDVNTLLLDKTGTITLGNRQAAEFLPGARASGADELADAAQLSSLADETPEGRSIVVLAKEQYGLRERRPRRARPARDFVAVHRPDPDERGGPRATAGRSARAPPAAVLAWVSASGGDVAARRSGPMVDAISAAGGTPLVVAEQRRRSGAGARRHPPQGRRQGRACASGSTSCAAMGIRTVMITGDNPLTAKAIADEAGVDDFLAEATPEDKMALIQARAGRAAGWSR